MKKRGVFMRKLITIIFVAMFLVGCTQEVEPEVEVEQPVDQSNQKEDDTTDENNTEEGFVATDPFVALSDDVLQSIEASGFEGTESEIASKILDWQNQYMYYIGDPNIQPDISYPMRWNFIMPGVYPVSEMVEERRTDDDKIYGLCWDYASIYASIANSYGLEVRVTALKKYMSDINPSIDASTKEGLAVEEYDLLNNKISKFGAEYTYSQIDRVARETWVHYRAEVKIDGAWVAMDGTEVSGEYENGTFEVVDWQEGYNANLLNAPSTMENDQLDPIALAELLEFAPYEGYVGITDDHGNSNRAATFKDLVRGRGFIPYFSTADDIIEFLMLPENEAMEILDDVFELQEDYESATSKPFYIIADFLLYADKDDEYSYPAAEYVKLYNALTNGNLTEAEYKEYLE
jgi:hypothetical protein